MSPVPRFSHLSRSLLWTSALLREPAGTSGGGMAGGSAAKEGSMMKRGFVSGRLGSTVKRATRLVMLAEAGIIDAVELFEKAMRGDGAAEMALAALLRRPMLAEDAAVALHSLCERRRAS